MSSRKFERNIFPRHRVSRGSSISQLSVKRSAFRNYGDFTTGGLLCEVEEGFLSGSERVGACGCGKPTKLSAPNAFQADAALPLPLFLFLLPVFFSLGPSPRRAHKACPTVRNNSRELQNAKTPYSSYGFSPIVTLLF